MSYNWIICTENSYLKRDLVTKEEEKEEEE